MFRDRLDAAARLAEKLAHYRECGNVVVLAVPRGGLPIGGVLARALGANLDVILAKKIGHPKNSEVAVGAVGLTGEAVDFAAAERDGIPRSYIHAEIATLRKKLRRMHERYHGTAPDLPLDGKIVIVTDDGAATGQTLLAAIDWLRRQAAAKIVVALPVAPADAVSLLKERADEVVCLETPESFFSISQFYERFGQVSEEEAVAVLKDVWTWYNSVGRKP